MKTQDKAEFRGLLLWIDKEVSSTANATFEAHLKNLGYELVTFEHVHLLIEKLKKPEKNEIIIISSGSCGRELIKSIEAERIIVLGIIIYCRYVKLHEELEKNRIVKKVTCLPSEIRIAIEKINNNLFI